MNEFATDFMTLVDRIIEIGRNRKMIEATIGFVVGVAIKFSYDEFAAPWLKKKLAYRKRVAARRAKKKEIIDEI